MAHAARLKRLRRVALLEVRLHPKEEAGQRHLPATGARRRRSRCGQTDAEAGRAAGRALLFGRRGAGRASNRRQLAWPCRLRRRPAAPACCDSDARASRARVSRPSPASNPGRASPASRAKSGHGGLDRGIRAIAQARTEMGETALKRVGGSHRQSRGVAPTEIRVTETELRRVLGFRTGSRSRWSRCAAGRGRAAFQQLRKNENETPGPRPFPCKWASSDRGGRGAAQVSALLGVSEYENSSAQKLAGLGPGSARPRTGNFLA